MQTDAERSGLIASSLHALDCRVSKGLTNFHLALLFPSEGCCPFFLLYLANDNQEHRCLFPRLQLV